MKIKFLFFFFFFSKITLGCECPVLQPISKQLSDNYDVIFYGEVDSVSSCNENGISTAYFTISELYKGSVQQHVQVEFDCASACMMSFSKGEEWLMYTMFQRFDLIKAKVCSHSRKFFNDATQDFYFIAAQRSFEQEKQFLKESLTLQPFAQNNELNEQQADLKPHNNQPSAMNKLWLLLVSVITMIVVYLFSRKKK